MLFFVYKCVIIKDILYEKGLQYKNMKNFIKKHLFDLIGWGISLLGVLATVVIAMVTEQNNFKIIFLTILATELVLVYIGVWNIIIKYKYEKEIEDVKQKNKKIESDLENESLNHAQILDKLKKENEKLISTITLNYKNASKLHNDFCNRIPEISAESYHLLKVLEQNAEIDDDIKIEELEKSYNSFANGLFELYKRYSTGLLSSVVNMVEAMLVVKGCPNKVSATIKLFNKPWYPKNNGRNHVIVYTAFRDAKTYEEHDREIGKELYTIDGNIDFSICVSRDHYIINNAKKDSTSYLNEHKDFDAYYNSAVVVPIRIKQADNTYKLLGYLCCDCLNQDLGVEVFDKEVAQLLFSLSQIYSIFLETLESNWVDRILENDDRPQSFLSIIYTKTFIGNKK